VAVDARLARVLQRQTLGGAMSGDSLSSILSRLAEAPEQTIGPGAMIDHYAILRLIGRGGHGEVFLARDTKLQRKVALKMIRADALGARDAVERFLAEARATAALNHPHIVTIYGVGEHGGG